MAKKTLRQLHTRVSNGLLFDYLPVLSHNELRIYLCLAVHADYNTGWSFPTQATICKETGIKSMATIKRNIDTLQEYGIITYEYRKAVDLEGVSYGRKRYFYQLRYPACNKYIK